MTAEVLRAVWRGIQESGPVPLLSVYKIYDS